MLTLAAAEVMFIVGGITLYIWRLQYTVPNFAVILLLFIVASFFIHKDRLQDLGLGSRGMASTTKVVAPPTAMFVVVLVLVGFTTGRVAGGAWTADKLTGLWRYFAWCLFQEFGLQSFLTNRLLFIFKRPDRAAWISAAVFASFHIPNPVLIPVTFFGGYVLSRVFISHRNLIPIALSQAIIGSLLSVVLPIGWHHGLRVGPGYYRFH